MWESQLGKKKGVADGETGEAAVMVGDEDASFFCFFVFGSF